MKRLNFVFGDMCCVRMQITDSSGTRYFYMETEKEAKNMEFDIFGDSFDLIVTPRFPDNEKIFKDEKPEKFMDKLGKRAIKSLVNFSKDMYFMTECAYHFENFHDGDTVNIKMTIYSFPSNNWGENWLYIELIGFPVEYMFYDASLSGKRLEPKSALCLNRKKVIRRARPFLLVSYDSLLTIISYPLQMIRIRYLSGKRKIFSTLLNFSRMDEEKRWKYISEDFSYLKM